MSTAFRLHPSYDSPAWKRWLDTLPDTAGQLPPTQLIQRGRNDVYWLEHEGRKLVLKRFFNRGPWKKTVYRIASSKARRSYEHSLRLMEIGLRSPQPVAWLEVWRGGWLHESYYICEHLDYSHDAKALLNPAIADWEQKAVLAGQTVAKLHDAGVEHLDLNSGNLLFVEDQLKSWQIYIIDNNRMRFGPVSQSRGVKSLLLMGLAGPAISVLIDSYAKTRGFNPENCRERYDRSVKRHELKWRIKDGTRPWRRKIGL